jgi:hypothetical protein
MAGEGAPWAPPLVEMTGGITGHLLAWERHERDGSWWAWVSWVQESGDRRLHKVVQVRAGSVRPLEPPEAYREVPRRVLGPLRAHGGVVQRGAGLPVGVVPAPVRAELTGGWPVRSFSALSNSAVRAGRLTHN